MSEPPLSRVHVESLTKTPASERFRSPRGFRRPDDQVGVVVRLLEGITGVRVSSLMREAYDSVSTARCIPPYASRSKLPESVP